MRTVEDGECRAEKRGGCFREEGGGWKVEGGSVEGGGGWTVRVEGW